MKYNLPKHILCHSSNRTDYKVSCICKWEAYFQHGFSWMWDFEFVKFAQFHSRRWLRQTGAILTETESYHSFINQFHPGNHDTIFCGIKQFSRPQPSHFSGVLWHDIPSAGRGDRSICNMLTSRLSPVCHDTRDTEPWFPDTEQTNWIASTGEQRQINK